VVQLLAVLAVHLLAVQVEQQTVATQAQTRLVVVVAQTTALVAQVAQASSM